MWLVIRYDLADGGARPVPNGEVYWASPDIWISGGDAWGNAIAGKPTKIHARIWNLGNFPATPTRVDFAFADPSLGIPWTAPQRIGTGWANVGARSTAVVECPEDWIPSPTTGILRACLLVTCSSPPMDPAPASSSPRTHRHTAQRNVTIVPEAVGQPIEIDLDAAVTRQSPRELSFAASLATGDPGPDRLFLTMDPLRRLSESLELERPPREQRLLSYRSENLKRLLRQAAPYEVLDTNRVRELLRLDSVEGESWAVGEPDPSPKVEGLTLLGRTLSPAPDSRRRVHFTLLPPATGKEPLIVHLFQLEDGLVTGGYTVIAGPKA
ncbi:MAG: hypothetical protein KDD47_24245 [Acidobacteria bacterium]|nr:hypothetical protein [Acidobacteriota bacterium]